MRRSFSPQIEQVEKREVPSGMISISGVISGVLVKTLDSNQYASYNITGQGDGVVNGLGAVHETLNIHETDYYQHVLSGTVTLSNQFGSMVINVYQQGGGPMYYGSGNSTGEYAGDYAFGQSGFSGTVGSPGVPIPYIQSF